MDVLELDAERMQLGALLAQLIDAPEWDATDPQNLADMRATAERILGSSCVGDVITPELRALLHREESSAGLCVIEHVPGRMPHRVLLLLSELMGNTQRFEDEGDYVIEVKEDPAAPKNRPGFNNTKEFFPHTDLSYVEYPPVFFCLHSLQNDAAQGGLSEFADMYELKRYMSSETANALQAPDFLFPAPSHFGTGGVVRKPILSIGDSGCEEVRFRRDNLRCTNRNAMDAVVEVCRTIQENLTEVFLAPNAVAVINNRRVLHGRTAFLGGNSARWPRHINRLYFTPNPDHEPADGAFCD